MAEFPMDFELIVGGKLPKKFLLNESSMKKIVLSQLQKRTSSVNLLFCLAAGC